MIHPQNEDIELMYSLIHERDKNLDEIIHFQKEYDSMISKSRFYGAAEIGSYINTLQRRNVSLDFRIMKLANANIAA